VGHYLWYQVLGKKDEKQHKHFKTFLAVQDPLKIAPSKAAHRIGRWIPS
jgi:hypothetical protein